MQAADYLINAANEDIPAAIPSLIDAAVAAFDVDVDASRRYLLRASALLGVKGGARSAESARRSEARGGLLAWQLNRVLDYIETHLAEKISAMALADLIEVSTGKLFRAFKISVGVTPFHYITRRRVELACTMMKATREPLSQLAIACGLCDQAHLCRVFRRMIGMSPSAWRRAMPEYAHIEVRFGDGPKIGFPKPTVETVTNAAWSPRGTTHDGASMPTLG
jgi:AraC-like DNA-binding protein